METCEKAAEIVINGIHPITRETQRLRDRQHTHTHTEQRHTSQIILKTHFTSVGKAAITEKKKGPQMLMRMWRREILIQFCWTEQTSPASMEVSIVSSKTNTDIPQDPDVAHLNIEHRGLEDMAQNTSTALLIAGLFTVLQL